MNDFAGVLISFVFVFLIIGTAEFLRGKFHLGVEFTRKFIHIGVGHWVLLAVILINSREWALIPPAAFVLINFLSSRKNLFQAMEGAAAKGLGTVYYSLSLLILVFFFWGEEGTPFLLAGIMVMAWGDGLAAIAGKRWGQKRIPGLSQVKTWVGSAVMLLSSMLVILLILNHFFSLNMLHLVGISFIIGLAATVLEVIFRSGWDNIAVPLGTAWLLSWLVGG